MKKSSNIKWVFALFGLVTSFSVVFLTETDLGGSSFLLNGMALVIFHYIPSFGEAVFNAEWHELLFARGFFVALATFLYFLTGKLLENILTLKRFLKIILAILLMFIFISLNGLYGLMIGLSYFSP